MKYKKRNYYGINCGVRELLLVLSICCVIAGLCPTQRTRPINDDRLSIDRDLDNVLREYLPQSSTLERGKAAKEERPERGEGG
jgi:hypothetical protein